MIRVLIDGAGGDVGQGILKALNKSKLNLDIYTSCIANTSSWLHKIEKSYIFPYVSDDDYIAYLITFLNEHKIDTFFPTVDSAIMKISEYKQYIEEKTDCIVFVDNIDKVRICDDKYETVKFLEKHNLPAPHSIIPNSKNIDCFIEKVGYPFIVKTRSGNGSSEVFIINNEGEYKVYVDNCIYMFQEYIPSIGGEYTTGIYLGDDGEVKGTCTFKRTLRCGSTYTAERLIDDGLEETLKSVARKLGLKYLNIQSMLKDGVLYPFEFNGRFSGTTGMVSRVFNAPEMFIREKVLKEKLDVSRNNEKFFVSRYFEEVYYTEDKITSLIKRSTL